MLPARVLWIRCRPLAVRSDTGSLRCPVRVDRSAPGDSVANCFELVVEIVGVVLERYCVRGPGV